MCIYAFIGHRTRENQGLFLVFTSRRSYSVNDCLRPRTGYAEEKQKTFFLQGQVQLADNDWLHFLAFRHDHRRNLTSAGTHDHRSRPNRTPPLGYANAHRFTMTSDRQLTDLRHLVNGLYTLGRWHSIVTNSTARSSLREQRIDDWQRTFRRGQTRSAHLHPTRCGGESDR